MNLPYFKAIFTIMQIKSPPPKKLLINKIYEKKGRSIRELYDYVVFVV